MKKKVVYIDMDGVIVNFQSGIDCLTEAQKKEYEGRYDEVPGIFSQMTPMMDAVASVGWLCKNFDVYILSTAPWDNPSAWTDKRLWVEKHLGRKAYKRLILSHNKHLNKGDYLIDDRTANGAGEFEGKHIHFGTEGFENWVNVLRYFNTRVGQVE